MKSVRSLVLAAVLLSFSSLFAQKKEPLIALKTGAFRPIPNIHAAAIDSFNRRAIRANDKAFVLLHFENIPDQETKERLAAGGIHLLNYIPEKAYTATIKGPAALKVLEGARVKALVNLGPKQKMEERLAAGQYPPHAVKVGGTIDVQVSFPVTFTASEVLLLLKEQQIDVLSTDLLRYRVLTLRISTGRLVGLATFPFVEYVHPAPEKDQPLNDNSRNGSRANQLNGSIANGGFGLTGNGVAIGVGDNSDVQSHIDFSGRLINRTVGIVAYHGTHVTGTMAGAGIINELNRGYAPKATIISETFSGIIGHAAAYVADYGMVITNNSYGGALGCSNNGIYDFTSQALDQMAFDHPELLNVYAAGNSGASNCAPFPVGFRTVLGGYQTAKNVLCVGNTTDSGLLFHNSSRGPVRDGRVKPEISAMGAFVLSSAPVNSYGYSSGTSMAAPAVSGGLALLYQRYRQLNGGNNPKSGLMKALVCNGGEDRGNAGPDFSYGFGWMNLARSIDMLENNRYKTASVTNGGTNTHSISVPANTAEVRVMLYWHDPSASPMSSKALVHDLDLEVMDPLNAILLPKILDTSAGGVTNAAAAGADHINNIEQVVISNPGAGSYTIRVKGTTIAQHPSQEYYIVYDIIPASVKITNPTGGEGILPNQFIKIQWDAYGNPANTFTLQYSTDDGNTWTDIAIDVAAGRRVYTWQAPATATDKAKVRVLKNGTAFSSTSHAFAIIGQPVVSLASVQCEGYVAVNWTAVAGATDYEVMLLQNREMATVAVTTGTAYTLNSLHKDSTYWVTVRARINGKVGRRGSAVSRKPSSGTCSGTLSDNDLKLAAVTAPASGRLHTSTALTAATPVSVQIKNLDDLPHTNFSVEYSINGGAAVLENVTATIAAGGIYTHTFATPANLSSVGSYTITAVVKNASADPVTQNDTLVTVVKQLDNLPISLASPFLDNLESTSAYEYKKDTTGLAGGDRYDIKKESVNGRVRTFVNSGMAYSGSKAFTIDVDRTSPAPAGLNYVIGTYHLSAYNIASNDLRLDFRYLNRLHSSTNTKVWVRGNDTQPWVQLYHFAANSSPKDGSYAKAPSLEVADTLGNNGQNFSSSFQVMWGLETIHPTYDKQRNFSIDDIRIYEVVHDLQLLSVDTPMTLSCGLNGAVPLTVSLRNSHNSALNNIPVQYNINGGPWVTEVVSSIAGNSAVAYTFAQKLNLATEGSYTIKAVVGYPSDSFRENDTLTTVIQNAPFITAFPSVQNFENGEGGFYTFGNNSSWQYGAIASSKIKTAASGSKGWKTRLSGNYNDGELSYLYTPCYQIGSLANPTLSLSMALDLEDCGTTLCDGAWIEFSGDGKTWTKLGLNGQGTNWYNKSTSQLWSKENYTRWHVATIPLPDSLDVIRFRVVMSSDEGVNREGIAVDDIHIYDNTKPIYDGATLATALSQPVAGNGWVHFESGGKLVASIHPNNQSLGTTAIQAFIETGPTRYTTSQYYHNRSITIKPTAASLADSATVRLYFLDTETENLLSATGCSTCHKPSSVSELGISKYSDADNSYENGTISDNQQGVWAYLDAAYVAKVPFDKGYYAEFKVKDFSEFWLNSGGMSKSTPLPVKLMEVTAKKGAGQDVLIGWQVSGETEVIRYEIELARGNAELQANEFIKIGEVAGRGNSTTTQSYSFTDAEADKFGARFYRLKVINADASFRYSTIRSVVFTDAVTWQVYPNPSSGIFNLVYQVNTTEKVQVKVFDARGRLVKEAQKGGNGYLQKFVIDLTSPVFANGVYLLQAQVGEKIQTYKVYKQ